MPIAITSFTSFQCSADTHSFCASFNGEIQSAAEYAVLSADPTHPVEISYSPDDQRQLNFIVELPERSRTVVGSGDQAAVALTYKISGRQKTALLGAPYAAAVVKIWGAAMASEIAAELCALAGISLDWRTVDWRIDAGAFAADGQTPLALLQQLVQAAGAVLQTLDDGGTLIVRPQHPVSPSQYAAATPDVTVTVADEVLAMPETFDFRPGYNAVTVGYATPATVQPPQTISVQRETIPGERGIRLKVFTVPYAPSVTISGSGFAWHYEGERIDDVFEVVTVTEGQGRLNHPYYGTRSAHWVGAAPGEYRIDESGAVTLVAGAGNGFLEITYQTQYRQYRIDPEGDITRAIVQIDTPDDNAAAQPTAHLTPYVLTGTAGDQAAPEILDALLTAPAVRAERARNELAENGCHRKIYTVTLPYTRAIRPGSLVEVVDAEFGERWRGLITAESLDEGAAGDVLQKIIVERPWP